LAQGRVRASGLPEDVSLDLWEIGIRQSKIGQIEAARREIHDFAGNQAGYHLEQEWLTHVRRCFLT
jgi:hypothetical protein